jgi:hypothetical protein
VGIDARYVDALGREPRPSAKARSALVKAMGGTGARKVPPADGAFADVVVMIAGSLWKSDAARYARDEE